MYIILKVPFFKHKSEKSSCVNECKLVRRTIDYTNKLPRIVLSRELTVFVFCFCDYCVTQSQVQHESLNVCVFRMWRFSHVLEECRVCKVHIRYRSFCSCRLTNVGLRWLLIERLRSDVDWVWPACRRLSVVAVETVRVVADAHFLELHDVLRQRAGLVWEDVLNLTELFVEVRRLHLSRHVFAFVVNLKLIRKFEFRRVLIGISIPIFGFFNRDFHKLEWKF